MSKKNNYKYGRIKEKQVAKLLRSKSCKVNTSPASRGPSDLEAICGSRRWKIQVKSTRGSSPPRMSSEEIRQLKIQASKTKSTPVIAEVVRGNVTFKSLRSGRKLKP